MCGKAKIRCDSYMPTVPQLSGGKYCLTTSLCNTYVRFTLSILVNDKSQLSTQCFTMMRSFLGQIKNYIKNFEHR